MSAAADAAVADAPCTAYPRRILIYGMNYSPEVTGVGRYTGDIGTYLADAGSEVEVVTAPPHYPGWAVRGNFRNRYSVQKSGKTRITRCPLFLTTEMRGIRRMIAPMTFAMTSAPIVIWRILTTRPDTLLCIEPTLFAAPAALLAARMVGARAVIHVQDLEIDAAFAVGHLRGRLLQRIAATFERSILRAFDAVVTISSRMKDRLNAKGVPDPRLFIVRNWVDLQKIKPMSGKSAFRRELDIPDDDFVVLYAGNIGAKQALPVMLNAAEQLAAQRGLTFVIAGEGPEKEQLRARYGSLGNVRFLPLQPEERLCDLLNLADLHMLPQDRSTADLVLPSKLGGMLASGKPILVTCNPGTELHEFLEGYAIITEPGDSQPIIDEIQRIMREYTVPRPSERMRLLAGFDRHQILSRFASLLTA